MLDQVLVDEVKQNLKTHGNNLSDLVFKGDFLLATLLELRLEDLDEKAEQLVNVIIHSKPFRSSRLIRHS